MASPLPSCRLLLIALVVSLGGSFHFGYRTGNINPSEFMYTEFTNASYYAHYGRGLTNSEMALLWSAIVNILMFGALIGNIPVHLLSDSIGRKKSLYISCGIIVIGIIPSALAKQANSFELFTIGRFLVGVGSGLAVAIQGIYLTEISPKEHRGFMGASTGVFVEFGFAVGSAFNIPTAFGNEETWPLSMWITLPTTLLLFCVLPFVPESPHYLVAKGRVREAEQAIAELQGSENVDSVIKEIQIDVEVLKISIGYAELLKNRSLRIAVAIGCTTNFIVAFSGVYAISYFSMNILEQSGMSALEAAYCSIAICSTSFFMTLVSAMILDKFGRRPIMLMGLTGLIIVDVLMVVILQLYESTALPGAGYMVLALSILFFVAYGISLSSIAWFITPEMMPLNARAAAQSLAMLVNHLFSVVAGFVFLPAEDVAGPYSFFLFIVPLVIVTIYFWLKFPETNNRTVEEIMESMGLFDLAKPPSKEYQKLSDSI